MERTTMLSQQKQFDGSKSDPCLSFSSPNQIQPKPSVLRRRKSDQELSQSPNSILDSEQICYAPSRQKRVTFAAEVFRKSTIPQRLQSMSLEDLDHGISFSSKAHAASAPPQAPKLKARSKSRCKSVEVLEKRLQKIRFQILESSFEIEVAQNEMDELEQENEALRCKLRTLEYTQMGYDKLQESVLEMQHKSRKYSSKIAVLYKAIAFYGCASSKMVRQIEQLSGDHDDTKNNQATGKQEREEPRLHEI